MPPEKEGEEAAFPLSLGEGKSRLPQQKQGDHCQRRLPENNYTGLVSILNITHIIMTNLIPAVVTIDLRVTHVRV